jgi:hypothetical protein
VTPRKPVRVRKARRAGTCPACHRAVRVGDLIASIGGGPFICVSHITRKHTDGAELCTRTTTIRTPFTLPPP